MIDMAGKKFARLTVIGYSHSNNGAYWDCVCECGGRKTFGGNNLRSGNALSCGCAAKESRLVNVRKAIDANRIPFPYSRKLKDLWRNMRNRCYDPSNKRWENYGGRGIRICQEWLDDYFKFYKWATENGNAPGKQIDRINNDGNYEPSNCRFTDSITQMNNTTRNRFLTWKGETFTVCQWARRLGIRPQCLQHRVDRGWSAERMFSQPVRK